MKKKILRSIQSLVLVAGILFTSVPMMVSGATEVEDTVISTDEITADTLVEDTYAAVSQLWDEKGINIVYGKDYFINPVDETTTGAIVETADALGYGQSVVKMEPHDTLEFDVDVETAGLYIFSVDYYCLSDKPVSHTISLTVNDEYQFSEAREMELTQYFVSEAYPFKIDVKGYEVTPDSYIRYGWENQILKGINHSQPDSLLFYLEKGANKISISMEKASVLLGEIKITSPSVIPDFETYKASYPKVESAGSLIVQEAERISYKNTTETRPIGTRDVEAYPYTRNVKLMSVIGGETWAKNGQTLYYEIEVEKTGWYYIALKNKQNDVDNTTVYRTITIDGKLPFAEAAEISIPSNSKWNTYTLKNGEEQPLMFYLEAGTHTFGIEADSSMMNEISNVIQAKIDDISGLSTEIKKIIGSNTDQYRDWDILSYLPNLVTDMEAIADELDVVLEEMIYHNKGEKSNANISNMKIAINQLRKLAQEPDEIPNNIAIFSEGSGSVSQMLGYVLDSIKSVPLEVDQIYFYEEGAELPEYKAGFFKKFWEELLFFLNDLFSGSDKNKDEYTEEITVWVNRASTYIDLMRTMADNYFTPETGIKVNIEVMKAESKLILANTTNTQPDVAMGLSAYLPYDLAIRGALADLRQFESFNETARQFNSAAFLTHTYGDGIYAIPETQDFFVLIYRKDLMDAMDIKIPDTWDDVLEILPQLQRYGMNFYVPLADSASFKTFSMTLPYILRYGGEIYAEDGMSVAVNNAEGLEAMKFMTNLFTIYGMPTEVADFFQAFRSGTIPIGVSNFSTYLKIDAAASELAGKWEIALMPGVENEDGVVERWSTGAGTASVIFEKSEKKDAAWEYLSWWSSAEVQSEFGTQLQLLFGDTYMWNTANMEAFMDMPIDEEDKEVIMAQWEWLHEFIKTPASYMIEREISNVWNAIVFKGENARSALDDAAITMNQEMARKMESLGLTEYSLPSIEKIESWVNEDE